MKRLAVALPLIFACSAPPERETSGTNALENSAPRGNYGFLTDFTCQSEADARGRIDTLVNTFHVTDVQFYDWFADYSTPTSGSSWTDPWFHAHQICRDTILFYIDELHRIGARAWAYVQSIA